MTTDRAVGKSECHTTGRLTAMRRSFVARRWAEMKCCRALGTGRSSLLQFRPREVYWSLSKAVGTRLLSQAATGVSLAADQLGPRR